MKIEANNEKLHVPVMLEEILQELAPALGGDVADLRYFDGTFGRGGHLRALLNAYPNLKAVAFDRDPEAIEYGQTQFQKEIADGRLQLVHINF